MFNIVAFPINNSPFIIELYASLSVPKNVPIALEPSSFLTLVIILLKSLFSFAKIVATSPKSFCNKSTNSKLLLILFPCSSNNSPFLYESVPNEFLRYILALLISEESFDLSKFS